MNASHVLAGLVAGAVVAGAALGYDALRGPDCAMLPSAQARLACFDLHHGERYWAEKVTNQTPLSRCMATADENLRLVCYERGGR